MTKQAGSNRFFQFNYIPYPLWRRRLPFPVKLALTPLLRRTYPARVVDRTIPTVNDVAAYLHRFGLIPADTTTAETREALKNTQANIAIVDTNTPPAATDNPIRLPAQWEPMERVILTWPVNFPPLWPLFAQMTETLTPVADVQINVNHPVWARAVHLYLSETTAADLNRVMCYHLPTDDIWVRDYGPYIGDNARGERTAVTMTYDPLENYPQARDDAMPAHWAAHEGLPLNTLDFHGEGGNVWSDGAGKLFMTNQVYIQNPELNRVTLLERLRRVFIFDEVVLLPRLRLEETGHVDLLVKLASADTMLVSGPRALFTGDRLRRAARQLRRDYNMVTLPTPPLYLNWFGYPVRRSYTNALTVNGRVLVPVYGVQQDDEALRRYQQAMPGFNVVPIDCTIAANGGGAVHCLTKEVPAKIALETDLTR